MGKRKKKKRADLFPSPRYSRIEGVPWECCDRCILDNRAERSIYGGCIYGGPYHFEKQECLSDAEELGVSVRDLLGAQAVEEALSAKESDSDK